MGLDGYQCQCEFCRGWRLYEGRLKRVPPRPPPAPRRGLWRLAVFYVAALVVTAAAAILLAG